jgi:hypothetical protein
MRCPFLFWLPRFSEPRRPLLSVIGFSGEKRSSAKVLAPRRTPFFFSALFSALAQIDFLPPLVGGNPSRLRLVQAEKAEV